MPGETASPSVAIRVGHSCRRVALLALSAIKTERSTVCLLKTGRRAGFGEVRALGRAFERVAKRHPRARLRDVFSDDGYFAAVIEVRVSGPRSAQAAARLFDDAWYDAFGPLSCAYEIERVPEHGRMRR